MAFCILGILIDEFNPFTFIVIPNGLNFLIFFYIPASCLLLTFICIIL